MCALVSVWVCHMGAAVKYQIPWRWSYRQSWATWCEYWEPNLCPLEEQQVVLTTEPSLRPQGLLLKSKLHLYYGLPYSWRNVSLNELLEDSLGIEYFIHVWNLSHIMPMLPANLPDALYAVWCKAPWVPCKSHMVTMGSAICYIFKSMSAHCPLTTQTVPEVLQSKVPLVLGPLH